MIKKYFLFILSVSLIASCGDTKQKESASNTDESLPNKENYLNHIKELEPQLLSAGVISDTLGSAMVKAYSQYAYAFPKDSLSPEFLFKAAEVASSIKQYPQALVYYQTISDKYPDYKYVVESLYLQGFIYDSFLNDDAKAKHMYEKVIAKYPDHKLADDSKVAISHLGKSDEELIKEFKKKNKG